jgi:dihydrolipoamide dehydrogenase
MAQAVRRLGGEVVLIEGGPHLLAREAAPLGEALGEVLRRDGVELALGVQVTAARRDGRRVRPRARRRACAARRAAAGRDRTTSPRAGPRPRDGGIREDPRGVPVDARHQVAEGLWAIGDLTGIWPLTHVGKYQARVVASNILGEPREANYDAVPRVVFTDPQAAAVGVTAARFSATAALSTLAKTETYTRAYAESNGFLTLLSDGERLTGAYALGPEAGEWLQQATLAIRARLALEILHDTIQPFPTFSEIFVDALHALGARIAAAPRLVGAVSAGAGQDAAG